MVVGEGTYELLGTQEQISILLPCWTPGYPSFITFPWERLTPSSKPIPIGWMDLNTNVFSSIHVHLHDDAGNEGHGITRWIDGRKMVAGVFWTDGRIYVDIRCVGNPDLAREVVSAELAHSVDYFLPLTDSQKNELMLLFHGGQDDEHTWWEIHDYAGEYSSLGGEAFMAAFTIAYSNMVPEQSGFLHKIRLDQGEIIRGIVGVSATEPYIPQPPDAPPTQERSWIRRLWNWLHSLL